MSGVPVLCARGVTRVFRDGDAETWALRGVDVELWPGEFVALEGPSGSGKSTLLSILGTLLAPSGGEVVIAGQNVVGLRDPALSEFRNRHLGFVFQFHHLMPEFTALENVLFPDFAQSGRKTAGAEDRARSLLERVGLSDRLGYRATQLSGGQKQRVAVARAVMMKPELVLADEPTGNLDRASSREVMKLLGEVSREEGTTFLISTHDPEVSAACQRKLTVVDGRVVAPP
jgi:lipoprotein-releasing system ATP-binding protein